MCSLLGLHSQSAPFYRCYKQITCIPKSPKIRNPKPFSYQCWYPRWYLWLIENYPDKTLPIDLWFTQCIMLCFLFLFFCRLDVYYIFYMFYFCFCFFQKHVHAKYRQSLCSSFLFCMNGHELMRKIMECISIVFSSIVWNSVFLLPGWLPPILE